MLAHLGPALTQGTDLITQAVGAWTLAALALTAPGTPAARRHLAAAS